MSVLPAWKSAQLLGKPFACPETSHGRQGLFASGSGLPQTPTNKIQTQLSQALSSFLPVNVLFFFKAYSPKVQPVFFHQSEWFPR